MALRLVFPAARSFLMIVARSAAFASARALVAPYMLDPRMRIVGPYMEGSYMEGPCMVRGHTSTIIKAVISAHTITNAPMSARV